MTEDENLLNDRDIANKFRMSVSWVRVQRHYRKNGKDHFLALDPVFIGSKPRYRASDLKKFLEGIN